MSNSWQGDLFENAGYFDPVQYLTRIFYALGQWEVLRGRSPSFNGHAICSFNENIPGTFIRQFYRLEPAAQKDFMHAVTGCFYSMPGDRDGYICFDTLQNVTGFLNRPEPLQAMVTRLCEPDFLTQASPVIKRHLCAKALSLIAAFSDGSDQMQRMIHQIQRGPMHSEILHSSYYQGFGNNSRPFFVRDLTPESG